MHINSMMGNACHTDLKYIVFHLRCSLSLRCRSYAVDELGWASPQLVDLCILTGSGLMK